MNNANQIRLPVIVSALVLLSTVAFADFNLFGSPKASAALDSSAQLQEIQNAQFTDRDALLSGLERRIEATRGALGKLTLPDSLKDALTQADDALAEGIKVARDATADNWEDARGKLASLFSAYASAVIQADEASAK